MPAGRQGPTPGGPMGAVLGVQLRNYGFTDLPLSLPLPRSDPVTRICESSYRRLVARLYLHVNSLSVESVSAVRVSLRELVSAAIVHKRERVQGVMRV